MQYANQFKQGNLFFQLQSFSARSAVLLFKVHILVDPGMDAVRAVSWPCLRFVFYFRILVCITLALKECEPSRGGAGT